MLQEEVTWHSPSFLNYRKLRFNHTLVRSGKNTIPIYIHTHTHSPWVSIYLSAIATGDFMLGFYLVLLPNFEVNTCAKREDRFLTLNRLGRCAETVRPVQYKDFKEAISLAGSISINAGATLPIKHVLGLSWLSRQKATETALKSAGTIFSFSSGRSYFFHFEPWNCLKLCDKNEYTNRHVGQGKDR